MQWLVEHMSATDDNDTALLKTFGETGRSHFELKQIPFTQELIGLEQIDPNQPALIYGSTQIVEKVARRSGHQVLTFWGADWFDPSKWCGKRDDLLNPEVKTVTARELRANWVSEATFIKSVDVKKVTGMVLEADKDDHDTWLIEHSDLDGDDLIITAPVVRIEREWRFFVLEGKVVTGSTYRRDGYKVRRHTVSPAAWAAADLAVQKWMPSPNIVIDIARTWGGEYKVIEFNCLSCSGFYSSDVPKLVEALESYARH
jgi:hypothetical protein